MRYDNIPREPAAVRAARIRAHIAEQNSVPRAARLPRSLRAAACLYPAGLACLTLAHRLDWKGAAALLLLSAVLYLRLFRNRRA